MSRGGNRSTEHTVDSKTVITPRRAAVAIGLGVVTLVCSALFYGSIFLTMSEVGSIGDDAPPFYPGIIMIIGFGCTFPPALVCTIVAICLVGFARCKLAWISLCLLLVPFALVITYGLIESFIG